MARRARRQTNKNIIFIISGLLILILVYGLTYYLAAAGAFNFLGNKLFNFSNPESGATLTSATGVANNQSSDSSSPASPAPALLFGSFSEYFIGADQIDWSRTTLYRDHKATALFFPPDYNWLSADAGLVSKFKDSLSDDFLNSSGGTYYDKRCLENNCLEIKNLALFFNSQLLARPAELAKREVVAVSGGVVGENWLVGFTVKQADKYESFIYYFNGQKFSRLKLPAFTSDYIGLFGFGGVSNDFLVVYGALAGQAYRIRSGQMSDLGHFFQIKVMDKGFKPEIIRALNGTDINWYVYSATIGRPWLIKLWQNGTKEVVGEAVFDNLFNPSTESATFKLVASNQKENILLAKVQENNQESWKVFQDRGFKNEQPAVFISNPITRNGLPLISIKSIAHSGLSIDKASAPLTKLSFSHDGSDWRQLPSADEAIFEVPATKHFFLQVAFPKFEDKFYSPFLETIFFDYNFEISEAGNSSPEGGTITNTSTMPNSNNLLETNSGANPNQTSSLNPAPDFSFSPPNNTKAKPLIPSGAINLEVSAAGFNPSEFKVKAGQSFTLALSATDNSPHIFIFPGSTLINWTTMVLGGETKILTFTAPKAGTYNFRDDVPGNTSNVGQMIVN